MRSRQRPSRDSPAHEVRILCPAESLFGAYGRHFVEFSLRNFYAIHSGNGGSGGLLPDVLFKPPTGSLLLQKHAPAPENELEYLREGVHLIMVAAVRKRAQLGYEAVEPLQVALPLQGLAIPRCTLGTVWWGKNRRTVRVLSAVSRSGE